jgi:putative chitinase
MINRRFFFDNARLRLFDGRLTSSQVDGLVAILDQWEMHHSQKDDRWLAYALGTVHHETGRTMCPIREWGGPKYFFKMYDKRGARPHVARDLGNAEEGDGVLFHGRGYVQLTGRRNYAFWQQRLGVDCVQSPDVVMQPGIASRILFEGMELGAFTGKKFSDFFSGPREDWRNARRIINRLDKADLVASYARDYYSSISYTTA